MTQEIKLAEQAKLVLEGVARGDLVFTHYYADAQPDPVQDHHCWEIMFGTDKGHRLMFTMEGNIIASVTQVVEPDGRRLLDDQHPCTIAAWLDADTTTGLHQAVYAALTPVATHVK